LQPALTIALHPAEGIRQIKGFEILHPNFFDTLCIKTTDGSTAQQAEDSGITFRYFGENSFLFRLMKQPIKKIFKIFSLSFQKLKAAM
jgi:hypothetical protein